MASVESIVVAGLLAAVALAYGRGRERRHGPPARGSAAAMYAGLAVLAVALLAPVEQWSHESFAMHMLQHLLLGVVAPPLLLAGRPVEVLVRTRSPRTQRQVGRLRGRVLRVARDRPWLPVLALGAYTLVWWAWHVPVVYEAAAASEFLHATEHATMVAAAVALWAPVVHPRRTPAWSGALLLLGAAIQGGILATLLTFAPRPWYSFAGWRGLDALQDQQLGGAMMWVVAGMVYLLGAAICFTRWLRRDELITQRRLGSPVRGEVADVHHAR
jgi:putative membrane protein